MPAGQMEATEPAVFEVERFEWAAGRIELVGVWTGVRARRFIRPTLVLEREEGPVRLLALLEHKPWQAADGQEWVAAFAWEGEPVKFDSADMNVGSGLDVKLPPPRMRPGKPRRFKHRAVARDAAREAARDAAASGPGVVTELPKPAAKSVIKTKTDPGPEPTAPMPARPADPKPTASADPDATVPLDAASKDSTELERLRADVERLRGELDHARGDRDKAREELRTARLSIEEERQARERAVADARADERSKANTSLSEGAELRASIERQRLLAYEARDEAVKERDKAIGVRDQACAERDEAIRVRKQAEQARAAADNERDRALKQAERSDAAREKAFAERDRAQQERDAATKERDTIVSLHDRGLPVVPPKPRFAPPEEPPASDLDIWGPRVAAFVVLLIFGVIMLHLLSSF